MWVEAFRLAREPRQSSIRVLVKGRSHFSKKRGQPMRSIQSDTRSHERASSCSVEDLLHHRRHLGPARRLFGRPLATIFMKTGLPRAFEFLAADPDRSLVCSGSLICIGGQGG